MTDVTNESLVSYEDPKGTFNVLMETVSKELTVEFDKGRLNGPQYAEVYLGSMQSVISQAIQFVLQTPITNAQVDLTLQQVITEKENTLKTAAEIALINQQIALSVQQQANLVSEKALIDQRVITEIENAKLVTANTTVATATAALTSSKNTTEQQNTILVTANINSTDAEKLLTDQRLLSEVQNTTKITADISAVNATKLKIDAETSFTDQRQLTEVNNTTKVLSEISVLDQRKATEFAQVNDVLEGTATPTGGIVGAQKALYIKQTDGFDRDAEQKLLKIMNDTWAVYKSTESVNPVPIPDENNNLEIDKVLIKAKAGISVV